ncbi:MAG: MBOAT family protein [Chloroflexi bacterium]|nr:MBOAT family protein [Chloroflexota bacterium]
MTFDLRAIALFGVLAIVYAALPARARSWALFAGNVIAIYWLQPPLPIRFSDFILPTATLAITTAAWWWTRSPDQVSLTRDDTVSIGVMALSVIGLSLFRFVEAEYRLTPSRPPDPLAVILALLIAGVLFIVMARLSRRFDRRHVVTLGGLFIIGLFIVLKAEPLAREVSRLWRGATGQDASLASVIDLNWLGFSYVAFRWLHTLRDRQTGQLPALSLREYVTYIIFFASFTAGPIDRAERFATDWRALPALRGFDAERWAAGLGRIAIGMLKKFAIADLLAQGASLNALNAAQIDNPLGLWALLYGYALRLFFDFSGYTDIAIGLGLLFGLHLPDNFNRPYLKTNITAFWQSWHMTLSGWARTYVFSPLSRWLLMLNRRPSSTVIVLGTQLATMIVIGLWHGIALNFVLWGAWHGIALFVHKQWSDRTRKWYRGLKDRPTQQRLWTAFSWFVTFQYVVIGWLWFALPDVGQAARLLMKLSGIG